MYNLLIKPDQNRLCLSKVLSILLIKPCKAPRHSSSDVSPIEDGNDFTLTLKGDL